MLNPFIISEETTPNAIPLFKKEQSVRNVNSLISSERYIIYLLQKYKILDENIHPTWRVKYLKQFSKSSSFDKQATIEVKLEKYNEWLKQMAISLILE